LIGKLAFLLHLAFFFATLASPDCFSRSAASKPKAVKQSNPLLACFFSFASLASLAGGEASS
jgi:hypothetical protein